MFDQASPTYFIELYENKKNEVEIKKGKGLGELAYYEFDNEFSNSTGESQGEKDDKGKPITFVTRLRHDLAHPSTSILDSFDKNGRSAIEKLRNYVV